MSIKQAKISLGYHNNDFSGFLKLNGSKKRFLFSRYALEHMKQYYLIAYINDFDFWTDQ